MGVLEDCADFVSLMGAGKGLFRHGSAADEIGGRLLGLIGDAVVPARTTTVFVSSADVGSRELKAYLHSELDKGLHPTVTVFDSERFTPVRDFAVLDQARSFLGADINLPVGMEPLPEDAWSQVADLGDVLRLIPQSTAVQRRVLQELLADGSGPSVGRLARYVSASPPGLTDGHEWMADHSALLGVPYALFGDAPGYGLSGVLDSPAPASKASVVRALGGSFSVHGLSAIVDELESGRASVALVHGWSPGETEPEMRWLFRDGDGGLRWAVNSADGVLPEIGRNGAEDPRTRLLEQPHTSALMLGPDGVSYTPEPPVVVSEPSPARVHLSVNSRVADDSILVGNWDKGFLTPSQRRIRAEAERNEGKMVLFTVRRGQPVERMSTLDPADARDLHTILENNPQIPVVLVTEPNDQLQWLVTQRHQRALVQPRGDGWRMLWDVLGPGGRSDVFNDLSSETVYRATSLAAPVTRPVMPQVRAWTASNTWEEAQAFYRGNVTRLRTPEAAEEILRMLRDIEARGLTEDKLSPGRLIKDSLFFVPDVTLPAFAAVVNTALRAGNDPTLAGRPSIEPQHPWLAEPIEAHTQTADENLLFGYLTDRPLRFAEPVGAYLTGLLWLRELMQTTLSAHTGVSPQEALSVVKAKGELDGERAARTPTQPELLRAHAAVVENLLGIVYPEHATGDAESRRALLEVIDCLSGEDRVAWFYVIKHMVKPSWPDREQELSWLADRTVKCYH